jgi:hypothetical protein
MVFAKTGAPEDLMMDRMALVFRAAAVLVHCLDPRFEA